jgi:hypothetical protein
MDNILFKEDEFTEAYGNMISEATVVPTVLPNTTGLAGYLYSKYVSGDPELFRVFRAEIYGAIITTLDNYTDTVRVVEGDATDSIQKAVMKTPDFEMYATGDAYDLDDIELWKKTYESIAKDSINYDTFMDYILEYSDVDEVEIENVMETFAEKLRAEIVR